MIFVTVGTNEAPFDRMLEALDNVEVDDKLVIQCGASTVRPAGAECVEFLSFDELVDLVRAARLVVTHAGVGSIAVALANGKRPIVVPRRVAFGEAVDDHQLAFARRFAASGQVKLVEDLTDLPAAITQHDSDAEDLGPRDSNASALAAEIHAYVAAAVASEPRRFVVDRL